MTEAEYLDPQKFPLSTQGNLSLSRQTHLDAINLDSLTEAQAAGHKLDREQLGILAELQAKFADHPKKVQEAQAA